MPTRRARAVTAAVAELMRTAGGPRLVVAAMLDAVGTGLILPLTVLFFVLHEHLPAHLVGLGMTLGGLIALVLAPLGGQLVDRVGSKRALISAWLLGGASVACYALVRSWAEIIAVVGGLAFASGLSGTARSTLLASIVEPSQVSRVLAIARSFRNAGYGVGGLLATVALAAGATGFRAAVYGDAGSFLIAAMLVSAMSMPRALPPSAPAAANEITLRTVLTDSRYLVATAFDALICFNQVALQVALPLWVVLYTRAPRELVGLLFTLNTVTVVGSQVRVTRDIQRVAQTPAAYTRAAVSMTVCAAAFLASHYVGPFAAVVLLVLGTLLLTATEMLTSAAAWVLSFGLADDNHRGKYLAVFGMGGSLGDAIGPSVSTALLSAGAVVVWPAIAALVGLGSLVSALIARSAVGGGPGGADRGRAVSES